MSVIRGMGGQSIVPALSDLYVGRLCESRFTRSSCQCSCRKHSQSAVPSSLLEGVLDRREDTLPDGSSSLRYHKGAPPCANCIQSIARGVGATDSRSGHNHHAFLPLVIAVGRGWAMQLKRPVTSLTCGCLARTPVGLKVWNS